MLLTNSRCAASRWRGPSLAVWATLLLAGAACAPRSGRPDGIYARVYTTRGLFVGRLAHEKTPLTVTSFVGLAEGTIENAAFEAGRPYYDGMAYTRVEPGHVIQTGPPASDRARGPGYRFPNEIHADLSHDHAGALNMANGGPNTNAATFCVTLGDRSYLDGDYIVWGEVVDGMDVVRSIEVGDVIDSVRIERVGDEAGAFPADTDAFRRLLAAAEERLAEHATMRREAFREWTRRSWPEATGPEGGVLTRVLNEGTGPATSGPRRVRYRGTQVRYLGHVIGRRAPPLEITAFASGENGVPGFHDPPVAFTFTPGETALLPALDAAVAAMAPGERRVLVVPAEHGYGRTGLYPPETPGQPRFVISPEVLLVYEVEVLY